MADTIAGAIEETAKGPARVTVDGTTVEAQKIADQIAAAKHAASNTAAGRNHFGLRFVKLEPPGAG
jgi:hypothetical protein